jgi:hypothetical protein
MRPKNRSTQVSQHDTAPDVTRWDLASAFTPKFPCPCRAGSVSEMVGMWWGGTTVRLPGTLRSQGELLKLGHRSVPRRSGG